MPLLNITLIVAAAAPPLSCCLLQVHQHCTAMSSTATGCQRSRDHPVNHTQWLVHTRNSSMQTCLFGLLHTPNPSIILSKSCKRLVPHCSLSKCPPSSISITKNCIPITNTMQHQHSSSSLANNTQQWQTPRRHGCKQSWDKNSKNNSDNNTV